LIATGRHTMQNETAENWQMDGAHLAAIQSIVHISHREHTRDG
jgi:hypothetical protein